MKEDERLVLGNTKGSCPSYYGDQSPHITSTCHYATNIPSPKYHPDIPNDYPTSATTPSRYPHRPLSRPLSAPSIPSPPFEKKKNKKVWSLGASIPLPRDYTICVLSELRMRTTRSTN